MIIRSALKGIHSSHGRTRFISSTSTPFLTAMEAIRNSLREKQQSSSKANEQYELVRDLGDQSTNRAQNAQTQQDPMQQLKQLHKSQDLEKLQSRRWRVGDIYSPRDLSPEELKKWRTPQKVKQDVFDVLGINPLHEYKVSTSF